MKNTDLQKWFEQYLKLVGLAHLKIDSPQYVEMRRVFHAAIGMMVVFIHNDLAAVTEEQAGEMILKIEAQVLKFFESSTSIRFQEMNKKKDNET